MTEDPANVVLNMSSLKHAKILFEKRERKVSKGVLINVVQKVKISLYKYYFSFILDIFFIIDKYIYIILNSAK